jgi:cysteine desulfurase/selenocysteine lyase
MSETTVVAPRFGESSVFTDSEIAGFRRETPGCAKVVHFNHAGASLMPSSVLEAVVDHLHREAEIGGYEAADEAEERLEGVYDTVAELIGAQRPEIAVVENATRAWDMAFYGISFQPGDRILTSAAEYASNVIAFLQIAERGVSVEVVPNDETGQLSVGALHELIDERVKVVAISHMPTNGGLVQPAAEIGEVCRKAGVLFLLDACQTVGQMPVDVEAIGCDILSATSRKYLRGPRGMGFLYVRSSVLDRLTPPFLDLHAARWTSRNEFEVRKDARKFENWEYFVAGKLGMGVAAEYALAIGLDRIWEKIEITAARLREQLATIPRLTLHDLGAVKGGIVSFAIDGVSSRDLRDRLFERGFNLTTSTVNSTRYDMEDRALPPLMRASVHYLTSEAECSRLVTEVEEVAASLRRVSASA